MERRSYYNRACERTADQSYFNRLFIPIPNPPQREACIDFSTPSRAHGAGSDAPSFIRITDAVALYPEAFSPRYQGIDHRFILTVFEGPGCSGASITLTSQKDGRPAAYRLSDFEFDRRAKSAMIRYQRGPLDRYLEQAPAQTAQTPAPMAPAPAAPQAVPAPAPAAPQAVPAPSGTLQPQASPAPAGGGLQPAPPSAPPQQALQPAPEPLVVPTVPAQQVPSRPTGPQEDTFRFPVHQVYRLNFCLADEQGCGEPAANKWCESQGFARASRWTREENIGALYPTVFIGNGTICDKFLCDGFEEITCTR